MTRQASAGRRAGSDGVPARRDKVAELARENAMLRGHVRTLVMTGSALLGRLAAADLASIEGSDFKAALDAAKVGA